MSYLIMVELSIAAILIGSLTIILLTLVKFNKRHYKDSRSVANAYDDWTEDKLLEHLWGEHVHLGYYKSRIGKDNFRVAKEVFVHELVYWSGLNQMPPGAKLLDVGCGIGGSSRILARDYGFDTLGISISSFQIRRARKLTTKNLSCHFLIMNALNLNLTNGYFDAVWSVEAGPHIPDKQLYADELQRVLRPDGLLVVADWNRRDQKAKPLDRIESWVMQQLLDQWAHPEFASVPGFRENLRKSNYNNGSIDVDDWTTATLPSWVDSILEGIRRPLTILRLGPKAIIKGLREIPTLLLMYWAFNKGMIKFGVFRVRG
uniref:Probable sterol-C-methyltransferase n=1 Tax=Paulinella chromatophora TaxID=39717 RepID=B1X4W4_PAUCH|nr:probable sterol-C-methyltransferase [Paulinella chromatophora]ACB42983.1 probable sterol-C-methyltransferase [Paulinella chromatophora]